ncbi:2-dehydro-3-deoxyphosphogluconate aldolase/(4S)-4-hydroxy-2-oxoglutarate aldolase [Rhodovulum imhoffii]|uniref:2-dehydro-3-deoxy-phosphogluconate aldolase n=1 Tax=Rhodovulum imhoffii TaxID=365340 RepID=A0A2T5BNU3_9RHOB|nr:bifunctional 4-hydroxy-2-oxoglutarate aldolase/2-dehydro-3-deoxy-phosphogluconate aldolase [Rhodovulum imhoffii]MBK5933833.1 keto-deoxy-phosphogluconate aldolase [Rhodovulum imhoffii]PTN00675.1 2-dehydro-3-deoxyphosphogluconate aldolase/(4S)-4-hydroxy-2-oxoglutarate aldolase [Rhodovulum imhoffii]
MTPQNASHRMRDLCNLAPVIPVIVIDDIRHARPVAEALVAGGLPVLEVTLRTPTALDAIRAMTDVTGAHVGAGTLVSPENVRAAKSAGARFGVSPGTTQDLLAICEAEDMPLLPGAATASEAMRLFSHGYDMLKFFPAESSGGVTALKALSGPLPQIAFCPTGGIDPANAESYLSLDNVSCVGGSWITAGTLMATQDWDGIEARARAAAQLGSAR